MREMFKTIVEVYKEDKKDFFETLFGCVFVFAFIIFIHWFVGTFCYDM